MASVFPSQKKTRAEKKKDDFAWFKMCADYLIDSITDVRTGTKEEILNALEAYEGELDESVYSYILNPLSSKGKDRVRKYPTRLRNYNILKTPVDSALGEKANEPDTMQCIATNESSEGAELEAHNRDMDRLLQQMVINELNAAGIQTGIPNQETPDPKEKNDLFHANMKEKRVIVGGERMEYLRYDKRIKGMHQQMAGDWFKCNHCFSFKEAKFNDVVYEYVDPMDLYVFGNPHVKYIEDANAAVRLMRLSVPEIIDRWYDDLIKLKTDDFDPIIYLESIVRGGTFKGMSFLSRTDISMNKGRTYSERNFLNDEFIDCYHITWKGFRKIKALRYISLLTGQEEMKEVDEEYQLQPDLGDIGFEEQWVDEVQETIRIADDMYLRMQPFPIQRNELGNKSKCKLPYNGIAKVTKKGKIYSWIVQGYPYQILVNILRYQMEKLINKNKDKLIVLPKGLIPKKPGWDEDVFIYYGDATGYLFVDEAAAGAAAAMNGIKVLDVGLGNYIKDIMTIISETKMDYYMEIGFSPQRLADVQTSAGKGTTEQAIARSFTVSRELFREFDEFAETEYQGLIDVSKIAWLEGKKGTYVTSDGNVVTMNLDGIEHMETEYDVFAKNNAKEAEKLNMAKQFAFSFAQNGEDPDATLGVLDTDNFSKIRAGLRRASEAKKKFEAYLADKQNEGQKYAADKMIEKMEKENQNNIDVANINKAGKVESARIMATSNIARASTQDKDTGNDYIDQAALDLKDEELQFKREKHQDEMLNADKDRVHDEKMLTKKNSQK